MLDRVWRFWQTEKSLCRADDGRVADNLSSLVWRTWRERRIFSDIVSITVYIRTVFSGIE
jgi:hypothetical protein